MQISHYNSLIYLFVGIIAFLGMYFSRSSNEGKLNFFSDGKPTFWIISALSIFAGTLFQFWILLLPVISLSLSTILVILSLIISLLLPILLLKNKNTLFNRFMELLSVRLKTTLFVVVIVFFLVIQPFALLYLGEKIIIQFLGGSYHFLMVFLISVAGLCSLIGGKKVVMYCNAMFGISVIASVAVIMILGRSLSASLFFTQMIFADGSQYFQNHNFLETNWVIGFIGFSVISWWIWWIDNSVFQGEGKQSEQRSSVTTMFASFSLIVITLVIVPTQGFGEIASSSLSTSALVNDELLAFFFVLGFVSVMIAAFSQSFHTITTIVAVQYFNTQRSENFEEKDILVSRLVIVLSALLTILYIPFAQYFGAVTLMIYVQYLACVAASLVGVFTVFVLWKNLYKGGIAIGIVGGMIAGVIVIMLTYSQAEMLTPLLTTPYGAATGTFFSSIICSVGGSVVGERKIAKHSVPV